MKHGTYSEAINAGFSPDQAGFFARMCIDTKSEIMCDVIDKIAGEKKYGTFSFRLKILFSFISGVLIGVGNGLVFGGYL